MKSKLVRLATACAVVIAGSLAWAAPASAADAMTCTVYGCYEREGWGTGYGYWQADGDIMHVCDQYADGWSVVVLARFNGTYAPDKWHTAGAGKCTDRSYGNLPEGTAFVFTACLGKYSENYINYVTCGPEWFATA